MGDIVSFPSSNTPRRPDVPARAARMDDCVTRAVAELERRNIFSPSDLMIIPRNMWGITQRARQKHGLKQEEIYSCTTDDDGSKGTKASKNARYYEARPNATPSRQFTKHPKKYFHVLRHIETLTTERFLDLAAELLHGTTALQSSAVANRETDHVSSLIELIDDKAAAIERACNLSDYFKRLGRKYVSYDVRSDKFFAMKRYDTVVEDIQVDPTEPWVICSDEAPPWPSVALFEEALSPELLGTVVRSSDTPVRLDCVERPWLSQIIVGDKVSELVVRARLWRELRLALSPVAPNTNVKPMFELRFKTRVEAEDNRQIEVLNEYTYWDVDPDIRAVFVDNTWWPAALKLDVSNQSDDISFSLPIYGQRTNFMPSEFCYFLYFPVSDETCRTLLDRPVPWPSNFFHGRVVPSSERWPVRFPHGYVGTAIEAALLCPDKFGVDLGAELKRDAEDKISRFEAVYQKRIEEIDQAYERAFERPQTDGNTP